MIIATSFMLNHYMNRKKIDSWLSLNAFFNSHVRLFLDFESRYSDIQHIAYTGCGGINYTSLGGKIEDHLRIKFPFLFALPINRSEVRRLEIRDEIIDQMFIHIGDDMMRIKDYDRTIFDKIRTEIHRHQVSLLKEMYDTYMLDTDKSVIYPNTARPKVLQEIDIAEKLIILWERRFLNAINLTSVGLVIAAVYCSQRVGENIDIEALLKADYVVTTH